MTVSKYLLKDNGKNFYVRPTWDCFPDSGQRGTVLKCEVLGDVEDVAPVVHAYWIDQGTIPLVEGYIGDYVKITNCSRCKKTMFLDPDTREYCPCCGAKMDGEKEG